MNYIKRKDWINLFFGLTITALCLWLAFRKVPFTELTHVLSSGYYYWLIPAVVAQFLAIPVRSQRCDLLLDLKDWLADSFWAQGVGYLFTNLFPFRLSKIARVLVMTEKCKLPVAEVAGSAIVE